MLPASRAAWVPVCIATPTSAWASAGASLVPSPHIATSLPRACSSRIRASLVSGVAWARKSSTPASAAIAAAVSGLSPVIMMVRMPMRRSSAKRSRMPPLTTSLRWMTPSSWSFLTTASGVPPDFAMVSAIVLASMISGRVSARPRCFRNAITESTAPLRIWVPSMSTPLIRVCAVKGTKWACIGAMSRPRRPYFSLASTTIERPSGVSSLKRGELRRVRQVGRRDALQRDQFGRQAVAEGDGAGLVQQQRVDVARRLDRAAGHREHVELHQPVHAGDADGGQQRADGGGDEGHEQGDQHDRRHRAAGILGEARDGHRCEQEDQRHARQQDRERDLVRRLLPLGAFDQRDHAVEER